MIWPGRCRDIQNYWSIPPILRPLKNRLICSHIYFLFFSLIILLKSQTFSSNKKKCKNLLWFNDAAVSVETSHFGKSRCQTTFKKSNYTLTLEIYMCDIANLPHKSGLGIPFTLICSASSIRIPSMLSSTYDKKNSNDILLLKSNVSAK